MVGFEENSTIKPKIYPVNYAIREDKQRLMIVITHDEYIFFANNRI